MAIYESDLGEKKCNTKRILWYWKPFDRLAFRKMHLSSHNKFSLNAQFSFFVNGKHETIICKLPMFLYWFALKTRNDWVWLWMNRIVCLFSTSGIKTCNFTACNLLILKRQKNGEREIRRMYDNWNIIVSSNGCASALQFSIFSVYLARVTCYEYYKKAHTKTDIYLYMCFFRDAR